MPSAIVEDSTGGGGTSNHAELSNLDYANANHTGFAGTDVVNTFTRKQTFVPSIADLEGSLIPAIDNPDFDTDLSFWTDDDTGWGWDTGAAIHATGQPGTLSQAISVVANFLYYFKLEVSGMTAGSVELFDSFTGDIYVTANGTYETLARVGDSTSDTIFINVSDDFNGRIESVAFSLVSSNLFPSSLAVRDLSNTVSGRFSASQGGLVVQSDTSINLESGKILLKAASLPSSYDSGYPNQVLLVNGFLFVGDTATITLGNNNLTLGEEGGDPTFGVFGATPTLRPTVTGSKGGNEALASLIAALASLGLISDATT